MTGGIEHLMSTSGFMPHGHCYLWQPGLVWLHFTSDLLIGLAYAGISLLLYVLVRRIRLPFSPVFVAFGLFIGLCGMTHFMEVWTLWHPDYWWSGAIKAATAVASVATFIGLIPIKPKVEEVVHTARLSEERRTRLESAHRELEILYHRVREADETKTRFFANVSHELRTPLALILGPVDRMLGATNLTPEQRRELEVIRGNGRTLLKQVNDLLDVAKLEAGRMKAEYAELDAAAWLRRVCSNFEILAEERRIGFSVRAPQRLDAQFDPDKLERVVVNLLSNAFKFTPDGGRVRCAIELEPATREREERIAIEVQDSGPGVRRELREAIFERFRQGDDSATRAHGGTGLGLAIARDFIRLHGGSIGVREVPGGGAGALFVASLPRMAPAEAQVARTAPVGSAAAGRAALAELAPERESGFEGPAHVPGRPVALVVEDNGEMNRFVVETLAAEFNVSFAFDGQEGLDKALALKPDLIVTDLMMPRMSGDQLVLAARANGSLDRTPILLLTAKADDELKTRLLGAGAQDYLMKPFRATELLARARNLVLMKRARDILERELELKAGDVETLARELALRKRQLEAALDSTQVALEQAEQASRVKTAFLGMVSHELRTPLSAMMINLQMLLRKKAAPLAPEHQQKFERLMASSRQMSDLIEGLLEYSRLESGRLSVYPEKVDLGAMLAEAFQDFEPIAAQKGLWLRLEGAAPGATGPAILTDARLTRVVLNNLVMNAVKFTREGGIALQVGGDGDRAWIAVRDTGPGISEQDRDRIFDPFEQLEPVNRKSVPGVGLGLALVKRIVETLGGDIELRSRVGEGSEFRVLLRPLAAPAASAPGPEAPRNQ